MTTRTEQHPQSLDKRCPECGFRARGKNHTEGFHHKHGMLGITDPARIAAMKKVQTQG